MNPEEIMKAMEVVAAEDGKAAIEILKNLIASLAGGGAPPPADDTAAAAETPAPPAPAPGEEEKAASIAASAELLRITGAANPGEALTRIAAMFTSVQTLEADRLALDLTERRGLIADLVTAGAETPATAWDGVDKDKRVPVKRLADEPIAELRARVKIITAAAGKPRGHRPPASTETVDESAPAPLTRKEIAACKSHGMTEAEYRTAKADAVKRIK